MEEYFKIIKKRRIQNYCIGVIISILIVIIIALVYLLYMNIPVEPNIKQEISSISNVKKIKDIEIDNENNKDITEILEDINESIVGISKIKKLGESIFIRDADKKLGIGTGMIVSKNGYILTNEHVSGQKLNNCYVTLTNGKNYKAEVVWSDSNIDLAIIKINAKNLPYVTLGDSSKIKVGQSVYAIRKPYRI